MSQILYKLNPTLPALIIYADMDQPYLKCCKCDTVFHYKLEQNLLQKALLFFLPVKVFFCTKCATSRYRLLTDAEEEKYVRV